MKRKCGVLMHVSSLWGDYSSGGFSSAAKEFIDFLCDAGFSYWQVLPFSVPDECNSPYKSFSAFGGNPYFLDLEALAKKGLLTPDELFSARQRTPYSCEYERLSSERLDLLMRAAKRVENKDNIESFIKENPYLYKFALFMAKRAANGDREFSKWESDDYDEDVFFLWKFIQYEFFIEWREIKTYANSRGIKIIGDMPIYVANDSADVYFERENFLLDEDGRPSFVAGVPPDYFSEDGQLWGNPLYNWEKMRENGYSWWLDRLGFMLSIFDGVRIDHFRGLESYYAIPYGAENAKCGEWRVAPREELIDKMRDLAGDKLIIAEDLGVITDEVASLVKYSGFPSMRVFQFGFLGDADSPHKPHNYPNNCVAYTGTHDNNTLLGYVWELDEATRREVLSYCGFEGSDFDKSYDHIIKTVLASHAGLVILPIQDLLGFGSDTRLNRPGVAKGNWEYRVAREQLMALDRQKYRLWLELYGRI